MKYLSNRIALEKKKIEAYQGVRVKKKNKKFGLTKLILKMSSNHRAFVILYSTRSSLMIIQNRVY